MRGEALGGNDAPQPLAGSDSASGRRGSSQPHVSGQSWRARTPTSVLAVQKRLTCFAHTGRMHSLAFVAGSVWQKELYAGQLPPHAAVPTASPIAPSSMMTYAAP